MALVTTTVRGTVYLSSGLPAANGKVVFTLTNYDFEPDGDVVSTYRVKATTNTSGYFSDELFVNSEGSTGSAYRVTFERGNYVEKLGMIVVPVSVGPVDLTSLLSVPYVPATSESVLALATAAAGAAQESADLAVATVAAIEQLSIDYGDLSDAVAAAEAAEAAAISAASAAEAAAAAARLSPGGIRVSDEGINGDGLTNVTTALQAVINEAASEGMPLIFSSDDIYLVDYLDIPDHMVLIGRAQFASSGYDVQANLPSRRSVVHVGKHVRFDTIEMQPTSQTNYNRTVGSSSYGTGLAANLFIDDYAIGNEVEIVANNSNGSSACLITGHHQNIGMLSSYRARSGTNGALTLSTTATGWQRPFIIEGSWSQDGVRVDDPEYDLTAGNIGQGLRIGGYFIRNYTRGFSLSYFDNFSFGPGSMSGRHDLANTDPGHNGILIAGIRDGEFAAGEISDSAEHGIRIASQNRRGSRDLRFGVMTFKRFAPSAIKINGGGGANVLGPFTGSENHDNKATQTNNISVEGIKVVDPFIKGPLGPDEGGKAKDLLRLSHIQGFYCGFIQIELTDNFYGTSGNQVTGEPFGDKPVGNLLAMNSAQGVVIGPVSSSTSAQRSMRKVRIDAAQDADSYSTLADVRNIHLHGWTMPHNVADMDAYFYFDTDPGNATINSIKIGDFRITNALFQGSAPLVKVGTFSGTPTGKITFSGVVQDAATLTWTEPNNYSCVVDLFLEAGARRIAGNAIDIGTL